MPMAVCYFRVLQVVTTNPGYVPHPLSNSYTTEKPLKQRRHRSGGATRPMKDNRDNIPAQDNGHLDRGFVTMGRNGPPPGLEKFYMRDIFECHIDGMPRWCSNCQIWKPDRSHHSSEVNKCTYKMDHYCPWSVCYFALQIRTVADACASAGLVGWFRKRISSSSFSFYSTAHYSVDLFLRSRHTIRWKWVAK